MTNNKDVNFREERNNIRKESRERRRSLSFNEQAVASESLQTIIQRQPFFLRSKTLGYYIANDGEIDPSSIANLRSQLCKKFYLPVLQPLNTGKLWFLLHDENTSNNSSMKLNRFGIPEPRIAGNPIPLFTLDVVFMPLVAFDKTGARLGMGGGFYDRSFSFKKNNFSSNKPLLIGLAHHCQEWNLLPTESWDIPLDAIITDNGIFSCEKTKKEKTQRNFLQGDLRF
ncbi:MAG: 5-formyltetrahydrofolate cyclo-ligase [Cellvibrionaceae bacterium]